MYVKILLIIVLIPILYVLFCLVLGSVTYFDPPQKVVLHDNPNAPSIQKDELTTTIWNIGYAGLGYKSDFFYDGGKMMRAEKQDTRHYFQGILNSVDSFNTDFVMLQEVDSHSKRSYFIHQISEITQRVADKLPFHFFSTNYKVKYIPLPWTNPMGKVHSGLLSLSKYEPTMVERHQLPGSYGFPNKLFFLRRCLLISYYAMDSGKQLILINIHNSAYDSDGELKKQEMKYIQDWIAENSSENNYIICGGDWNQCPPEFKYDKLAEGKQGDYLQTNVKADYFPNGQWVYDSTSATNRKNNVPYTDKTFVTLIDFFWVSDNVEIKTVKGINQDFEFSDHQPVMINFALQ